MELIKTTAEDLKTLFLFQKEEESNFMAAFTSKDPTNERAYFEKWEKIIRNPEVLMNTIWKDGIIVGSVLYFTIENEVNVSYIVDKRFWGLGYATNSLKLFIAKINKPVLFARVAYDNIGSQKVLEKNSFVKIAEEFAYANAREKEIKEFIYKLEK